MNSLISFSPSGNMPFWAILTVFLLVLSAILIGIVTMWQFLQQKIFNNLSARVTACGTSGKIANDLSAHDTQTFNAELSRIYAEINNKLTAEIRKINLRNAGYTTEAQKILSMVNNLTTRLNTIEATCRNDFGRISSDFTSINASIESLQNEMIRHYAVVRRIQPVETDQLSVTSQSETLSQSSQSHASSSGSSGKQFGISISFIVFIYCFHSL